MSSWIDIREIILNTVGSYDNNIRQNLYLRSIIGYFTNSPSQRSIRPGPLENVRNLFGKDARIFYKLMEQRLLPRVYEDLITEAEKGFNIVYVKNRKDLYKTRLLLKFLNLPASVEVSV